MSNDQRRGDVAVFIDFENIYISVRSQFDANPNFETIMDECQRYGRVTIAKAYADWYRYPRVTNALYANAIEPMYVPTYHYDRDEGRMGRAIKNSVDMHLCIDLMKTLYAYSNIETFVLLTGDRDFIPLINAVRQLGKRAVVIGVAGATASHLAQAADEFLSYSQLVQTARAAEEDAAADPYQVLVEAVARARKEGQSVTLATLKLLMLERMPSFDEARITDQKGRPVSRFRDFLREAERRKLIQVFTSGSVTEVFLPGEDPKKSSQFAPAEDSPTVAAPPRTGRRTPSRRTRPAPETEAPAGRSEPEPAPIAAMAPPPPVTSDDDDEEGEGLEVSDTAWAVFEEAMRQFTEPVLFIQVYDALRSLRNKEIFDLSNHDIKRMIKLAINEGLVSRTTRGSHAYYGLNPDRPFQAPVPKAAALEA